MNARGRFGIPLLGTLTALALTLGGCASGPAGTAGPAGLPTPTTTIVHSNGIDMAAPGAFRVRYDATELLLEPHTWCYGTECVDGIPLDPASVGSPDELVVFVPVDGFDVLSVSQRSGEDWCTARSTEAEVEDLGDGWWRVTPRGAAGRWIVDLFATGDDATAGAGDMAATLIWETPVDHPLPEPTATLVVIADHDGRPDSYGLEFAVRNLAQTPDAASATITVTAGNGASLTFDTAPPTACAGEGVLWFDGPDAPALEASRLGDFPFTYDVTLTLDGVEHRATAVYPDDAPSADDLAVPLEFSPALP